tara:strand:+ start:87 stop:338 length:252 start_codon:yes stop_codon:yes gene_type:complete
MRETKAQYGMRAIQKLSRKLFASEEEVYELKKELAELKASLPQIKHNAIIGLVDYAKREDILFLSDSDVTQYAQNTLTQAKEQ